MCGTSTRRGRGDAVARGRRGTGTAPARCSPTLCRAPLLQPEVAVHPRPGAQHPLPRSRPCCREGESGPVGKRCQSSPPPAPGGSGRAGDVQPIWGMEQTSRPTTGISPTPGWPRSASLGIPCPSLANPARGPPPLAPAAIPPGGARQPEGSPVGERPWWEMQQSGAGKERDAGGGGGTPAPLAVATATPAVRPGQWGLERGVGGTAPGTGRVSSLSPHAAPRGHGSGSTWSRLGCRRV